MQYIFLEFRWICILQINLEYDMSTFESYFDYNIIYYNSFMYIYNTIIWQPIYSDVAYLIFYL